MDRLNLSSTVQNISQRGNMSKDDKDERVIDFASARKTVRLKQKADARKAKEEQANANRVRFGRTGAEKKADRLRAERIKRELEGAKRDDAPEDGIPEQDS